MKGKQRQGKTTTKHQPKVKWAAYNYYAATIITSFCQPNNFQLQATHAQFVHATVSHVLLEEKISLSERYFDSLMKSSVWEVRNCFL